MAPNTGDSDAPTAATEMTTETATVSATQTPTESTPVVKTPSPSGTTRTEENDGETVVSTGTTASETPTTVRFQSAVGTQVVGTRYGLGDCGVVLVPQINLDRESWDPQATALAARGYIALAIDEDPTNRAASVTGAVRYLSENVGVSHIVLVGASSGGEAVVRATARAGEGEIQGLVTLSAGGGADVAEKLQGRKLFVVSKADDERFVRIAKQLYQNAPEPKDLKLYSGSAHGQQIFETHGEDLRQRLFEVVEHACSG
jgi:pimeloyl-ACP methyl ester carboxylesterase